MNNVLVRFALFFAGILAVGIMAGAVRADTVVQVNLNGYVDGIFDGEHVNNYQVQLFDSQTPITVANFLQYVNNDDYNHTIIHRDIPGFIVQGGGFELQVNNNNVVTAINPIATYGTIQNEFDSTRSNLRGTIAMAKLGGDPNSATSQWFVNLADNSSNLDNQNGGFTVFGHVAGEGMSLIDGVAALPTFDLDHLYDPNGTLGNPFTDVPLANKASLFVSIKSVEIIPTVQWKGGAASAPTDWGLAANWDTTSGVPNGAGVNLSLGSGVLVNSVLDLGSANRTVGNIYYTIPNSTTIQSASGKSLTLDNNGSTSLVNVLGDHSINTAMILNNNALFSVNGTLTISGNISGTGSLAKNDVGRLTLTGTNTYTGKTIIDSGELVAGNPTSLPGFYTSGRVTVKTGATLAVRVGASSGEWDASAIDTLRNNVAFDAGAFLGFDTTSGDFSYDNVIGGSLGVAKLGTKTLILTGANTFTGAVNFNDGLIKAAALNNLGAGTALNFNGGGLQFDGVYDPSARTMTFQAGGATLDTQSNDITLANTVGNNGDGGLTKLGSGKLTLSASPIYNGATVVSGGTLLLGSGATLPTTTAVNLTASGVTLDTGGISQTIGSLTGVAGSEVKLGGSALTVGDNTSTTFDGAITSATDGSLTKTGQGTLTITGTNTYTGNTLITSGALTAGMAASLPGYNTSGKVTINAGSALIVRAGASTEWTSPQIDTLRTNAVFNTGAYLGIETTSEPFSYSSNISGNMGFAKVGSNTLMLTGSNSYTGNTLVMDGTLETVNPGSLSEFYISGMVTVYSGATFAARVGSTTSEWIASAIDTLRTHATFNTGAFLGFDTTSANFPYASDISGSLGVAKLGANTLTLTGANTFTGAINFNGGLIKAASLSNLGAGTALNFNGGGLQFDGVYDPSLLRTMTFQASGATLDTQTNNITLVNSIGAGGSGGLTKLGSGTLELTGGISYDGDTTITAGELKINNNLNTTLHAISGVGNLTVNGATTVLTASSISVNTLTVGPGSTVIIPAISGGLELNISPVSETSPGLGIKMIPEPSAWVLLTIAALAALFTARGRK